ncbi:MAG: 3-oxoadipate enol-lactonase [Tabrizicola sp.]
MLIYLDDLRLNAEISGPEGAPAVVFIHALGTNLSIWDAVIAQLPPLRILRYDQRGHGRSDVPRPPYTMGALVRDAERIIDHFKLKEAVIVGLSAGGMVAQGLAVKRLDLVRGLVLSNTAPRISTPEIWAQRIDLVRHEGLAALADGSMERMLGRNWRENPAMPALRAMLLATNPDGWIGIASAIAGTDFYSTTATLTLPTLAIAGSLDAATPPDMVREMADLIRGSRFQLLRAAGHLPPADQPEAFADALVSFLASIGHV